MEIEYRLDEVGQLAERLADRFGTDRVFALEGELGAGKTTLVAAICRRLGVEEPVSSPTFSIVNEYTAPGGPIYHLDAYRLNSTEEAIRAGLEELLATAPGAVFVEWPEVVQPLLPPDVVYLGLRHLPAGEAGEARRCLTIRTTP